MKCLKTSYANEGAANDDILRIQAKSKRNKVPQRAYLCDCGKWHLTSQSINWIDRINKLREEIKTLKLEILILQKTESKEIRLQLKKDEQIIAMRKGEQKNLDTIKRLRSDNRELIDEIIQLKNK